MFIEFKIIFKFLVANHDQQLEKDVKNQKKSVFNRLDLEYDQERIEKYERKREKVEKKREEKKLIGQIHTKI